MACICSHSPTLALHLPSPAALQWLRIPVLFFQYIVHAKVSSQPLLSCLPTIVQGRLPPSLLHCVLGWLGRHQLSNLNVFHIIYYLNFLLNYWNKVELRI